MDKLSRFDPNASKSCTSVKLKTRVNIWQEFKVKTPLKDGLCLVVALIAIRFSRRDKAKKVLQQMNTFGWVRKSG